MGLLDEMKKNQETKVKELTEEMQDNQTELIQENLNLKLEIDKLNKFITTLNQENSTLNNENKSLLESKKKIEEIKNQNQKLTKELNQVKSEVDKIDLYKKQTGSLQEKLNNEVQKNRKLKNDLNENKNLSNTVIDNYHNNVQQIKVSLVGNVVLSAILLIFITYQNKPIFKECGEWFKNRATNLYDFFLWVKNTLYIGTYKFIEGKFKIGEVGSNLITIFIMLLIVGSLLLLFKKIKDEFELKSNHVGYYHNKGKPYLIFKTIISIDIAIGLFVACLTFYEPFKKLLPSFNIFSIWILFTFAGLMIWNGKDLIKGFR